MKTIDEGVLDHIHNTMGEFLHKDQSFKAGVDFTQRWIPVDEDLPSEDNELIFVPVIAITGYGNYRITVYDGFNWTSDEIVTFWRPIELK